MRLAWTSRSDAFELGMTAVLLAIDLTANAHRYIGVSTELGSFAREIR
jgi:hypothetical protein